MRKKCVALFVFFFLALFILLTGCATENALANITGVDAVPDVSSPVTTTKEDKTDGLAESIEKKEEDTVLKEIDGTGVSLANAEVLSVMGDDQLIRNELERIMLEFGEDEEVPQIFFDEVKGYIRLFQTNPQYKKFITASLRRSSKFMAPVKEILGRRGIPQDMAYIAFIESGFNPRALSHAGAVGMWQFIPGTARNYSLKVGRSIDERLDPVRSTYAAADYFHDLIAIFGPRSFLLAIAAYNSGEGKIISCLKEIENPFEERNFWHIRSCLSKETREYPPKIIASSIIGNNPEAFGFPKWKDVQDDTSNVVIATDYNLQRAKVSIAVYTKPVAIKSKESSFQHRGEKITKKQKPVHYTVRKGNRLDLIANAFSVNVSDIRKWNKLPGSKLIAGQRLKIYAEQPLEAATYKVRKGDTITEISEAFRVRSSHIVLCNGLKNGLQIKEGQTLVFYRHTDTKPIVHIVKKGTNLARISEKYKVSMKDIMMWNNMATSTVYTGQKLKIYSKHSEEV